MNYKGYTAILEVDEEAGVIFGRVAGLRDVITFQGETIAEARKSFEESVDFYLEMCSERGESPERPFSGKFLLRVPPDLHRELATQAEARRMSLNALAEQALGEFLRGSRPEPEAVAGGRKEPKGRSTASGAAPAKRTPRRRPNS